MNNKKIMRGTKYAFNINDIKAPKDFKGSLSDFKSLNRGYYDEIESNDITIKDNIEKLKLLKNDTIKQFIYTNKDIPVQWKNKLDYKKNLLRIFINDTNFLSYLGVGNFTEVSKSTKNKRKKQNIIKEISQSKTSFDIAKKSDQEKITNSPNRSLTNKNKYGRYKEKHNYTNKEIVGILEEFKSAYPILIKEKENNELYNRKKEKNYEEKINKTFYNINERKSLNKFSLPNLKLIKSKRQNTFRQNIFTNLLPSGTNNDNIVQKLELNNNNNTSRNFYQKKKNKELKNRNDLYLNSNSELFDKKININNPTVVKYLEGINFYGPYFSYCPPCGNKNLEFYKNLEENRCLQIIQQIKKNKGKNILFNNNKNKTKKV